MTSAPWNAFAGESMDKYVDILQTRSKGQVRVARVRVVRGKLKLEKSQGCPDWLEEHLTRGVMGKRGKWLSPTDGEKFLSALKYEFSGSYFRATDVTSASERVQQ